LRLYIHVPFCSRRCSYCDFSIAVRREVPVGEFVAAVAREIEVRAVPAQELDSVYMGGGTPSKLGAEGVRRLLDTVRGRFTLAANAEVTLETNPEDVSADAVRAWADSGVNRVSLGVQSFDDRVLVWMHRTHTAADIGRAVRVLREGGINDLSLDLIFALPESLGRDWQRDLGEGLSFCPEHLSVYGLTVEPATPLGRWTARGAVSEAPEERWALEFEEAHRALTAAGYSHYEVSSYAREGFRSRHNAAYWSKEAYVGLGPSAHGFDGLVRRWNRRAYAAWLAELNEGRDPVEGSETLDPEQRLAESVYLGLRTDAGLALDPRDVPLATRWVEAGWGAIAERHDSRNLVLTASGWMRLDALAGALTAFRSRY